MKKLIRGAAVALCALASAATTMIPAAAGADERDNLAYYSCVYQCGAGPDGQGGVPADQYAACKANCQAIYGIYTDPF